MIKKIIKIIIYGYRATSETYVKKLRKMGMVIGEGTKFINPRTTTIDETRPWMIKIGNGCCITSGVTILTHDYGWSVLKAVYGEVIGSAKKVSIGDYVYIGMHTTIVGGVTIGNNVIIGANSLVSRDIPDNVVVAGNPARVIGTLEEYYHKRKSLEIGEAVEMAQIYYETYKEVPPIEIMREHFWLFENNWNSINPKFKKVNGLVYGSEEITKNRFIEHTPVFRNYEEFLNYCNIPNDIPNTDV